VYRKNGNLFFRTTIQTATAMEQSKNSHPFTLFFLTTFLKQIKTLKCYTILIVIILFLFLFIKICVR